MNSTARRKKFKAIPRPAHLSDRRSAQDLIIDGYAPSQMIEDLRKYQAELEIQNKALRYSQQEAEGASERFATLFSNVPLALMVVDEEGLVMASNAMALRLFQPHENDPPLNFLLPFVGADHTDDVAVAFLNAKTQGSTQVTEISFLSGVQGTFTGDLHIARIENPTDELAHFICAIIDQGPLLAQRRALQESASVLRQRNEDLLLSENRMAAIINSSLDAILCIDASQCITVFNPAATALFECPAENAFGTRLGRFLPDLEATLASGQMPAQSTLGEFQANTLLGKTIFVEISVSLERRLGPRAPLQSTESESIQRNDVGKHSAITTLFVRDLTAKKEAELRRLALETQLRESQKMQAMGTMAGGIAHDFNNILSAILGNVTLAMQDSPPDAAARTSLQEIDKAGRRARDLVRQILTFSRNEPPKRTPINLAEVVQDTARLIKVTLPPLVDFQVSIAPTSPNVLADATQVEQALLNLCTNAILAVGQRKGTVRMELSHCTLAQPECGRIGLPPGGYTTVSVSDTGSGIAPETLGRIFEPFFTTRVVGQGTGLGLSVVHGIMQTHQGTVQVHSTVGRGSHFALYFPSTLDAAHAAATPEPAVDTTQSAGGRIMYVDDDEALVFLIRRVLTRKGYTVTTHTDPQTALRELRENPQGWDLLVTDYNMPGFSGVELLREVRNLRPDLPVAMASGYVTPELEERALQEGASALIYKPNDVHEFCDTVQRLLSDAA